MRHFKAIVASSLLLSLTVDCLASGGNNINSYYKHIYDAEQRLIRLNYGDAAIQYKEAFKHMPNPFALDLYNASVCAAYLSDNASTLVYAKKLILKGADTSFFRKYCYRQFRGSAEWSMLLGELESLKAKRTIDAELVATVTTLVDIDQVIHKSLSNNRGNTELETQLRFVDVNAAESLRRLMLAHDFLNEEVVGAEFSDTTLVSWPLYGVIVLHEFENQSLLFKDVVERAIRLGKLKPEPAIDWIEHGDSRRMKFLSDYFVHNDTLFVTDFGPNKDTARVVLMDMYPNEKTQTYRADYYVDTPENIINKMKFQTLRSRHPALYPDVASSVIVWRINELPEGPGMENFIKPVDNGRDDFR